MEGLVANIKATISALSIPSQTAEANKRLVEFEQSREAWEIIEILLHEPPGSQFRFFCSITLYSKVQRDLTTQLDASIIPKFTQNLVSHLIRFAQEPILDMNVCRYICLSIAATAVQLNQDGVIHQILTWLNPIITTSPQVVLELLILLPEECFNRNAIISNDTRHLFALQLTRSVSDVFAFLTYVSTQGTVSTATGCQILKCIERWIDNTDIAGNEMTASPIFQFLLESFNRQDLFEAAIETAITLFRRFRCSDQTIIAALFPRAVAMTSLFEANVARLNAAEDPEDLEDEANICRAICRLATEAAEACMPIIVGDEDNGQMALLSLLLQCVSYRFDFDIARIPLRLFYELCLAILRCLDKSEYEQSSKYEPGEEDEFYRDILTISAPAISRFTQVYSQLFEATLTQLVLPANVFLGTQQISDQLEDKRIELKDTISDCIKIIGCLPSLQIVCGHLQRLTTVATGASTVQWNAVEAILFAAQNIPAHINSEEAAALFIQLLSFIPSIPDLPGFKVTIFGLIQSSARILKRHPQLLVVLVPPILQALHDPKLCEPASNAIKVLFSACGSVPELPIAVVFEQMVVMRTSKTLPLVCDLNLIEGLVAVVSQLPKANRGDGFGQLLTPIAQRLASSLQTSTTDLPGVNADIDRITCVLRFVTIDPTILMQAFTQIQPMLQAVLQLYTSENTCEKVCRYYKHLIRNAQNAFVPLLPGLLVHLQERFKVLPYSAFIYCLSSCVSTFARVDNGAHVAGLYEAIWGISTSLFSMLTSVESFSAKPDLIEEYFYLLKKTIDACPVPFVLTVSSESLVQAGLTALHLHHRDAQKCVLLFFESLIDLPDALSHKHGTPPEIEAARNLILKYAPSLVDALFQSLSGLAPIYALDENNGCICDVLWSLNKLSSQGLQTWINSTVVKLPEAARNVVRQLNLIEQIRKVERKEFSQLVRDFDRSCRPRR